MTLCVLWVFFKHSSVHTKICDVKDTVTTFHNELLQQQSRVFCEDW